MHVTVWGAVAQITGVPSFSPALLIEVTLYFPPDFPVLPHGFLLSVGLIEGSVIKSAY